MFRKGPCVIKTLKTRGQIMKIKTQTNASVKEKLNENDKSKVKDSMEIKTKPLKKGGVCSTGGTVK